MEPSLDAILGYQEVIAWKQRFNPKSFDEFISRVFIDLDIAIRYVESTANWQEENAKEDLLTSQIVGILFGQGYNVTQDSNNRGHADISLERNGYKWLAEAKIYRSYKWLFKGVTQLLNRYSSGRNNENTGSLIIYFFETNIKQKMNDWRCHFQKYSSDGKFKDRIALEEIINNINEDLSFESQHTHEISGLPYKIKHVPVMLYHSPLDRDL